MVVKNIQHNDFTEEKYVTGYDIAKNVIIVLEEQFRLKLTMLRGFIIETVTIRK